MACETGVSSEIMPDSPLVTLGSVGEVLLLAGRLRLKICPRVTLILRFVVTLTRTTTKLAATDLNTRVFSAAFDAVNPS